MYKKSLIIVLALTTILAMTYIVNASFNYVNASIMQQYSSGDTVSGWVNMNFTNQTNSNFTSNFNGGISLLDLLNNAGLDYTCLPSNCQNSYAAPNAGSNTKSLQLNQNGLLGFKLTGNSVVVNNLSFTVSSDAGPSCFNQFYIDFLNDGIIDFYNNNYVNNPTPICGSKNFGCFNSSASDVSNVTLGGETLCEEMILPPAPAYRIGAVLSGNSSHYPTNNPIMEIFDINNLNSNLGSCKLPSNLSSLDCLVNYSSMSSFDALVCVYANTPNNYSIVGETAVTPNCGTWLENFGQEASPGDYEIYEFPMQYAPININFNNTVFQALNDQEDISSAVNDYISNQYGTNCPTGGCIVPFKIGGINQSATISNAIISYSNNFYPNAISNNVYDVFTTPPEISTNYLKLPIDYMNFTVPNTNGQTTFTLSFNNKGLFSQNINISTGFTFSVSPTFVAVGQTILYTADVQNAVSSLWDFGDGSPQVSSTNNQMTHEYSSAGQFTVTVEVKLANGAVSTKKFLVLTGNAHDSANTIITSDEDFVNNASKQINLYPDWIKNDILDQINISDINSSLKNLRGQFNNATNDTDYTQILTELSNLNVPHEIYSSQKGDNLPMLIAFNNIDISHFESMENVSLTSDAETKLKNDIASWINKNYDATISFEVISEKTDSGVQPILTRFTVTLNPKGSPENAFLVIGYPKSSITFASDYGPKDADQNSATYIDINGSKVIEFLVNEEANVQNSGVYLAPPIAQLGTYEQIKEQTKPTFKIGLFLMWMGILIVVILIIYIVLQEWYKKNYENSLFKNKDDLFNLINFIYNSRSSGLSNNEIKKKLEKAGWKSEQISYAFNKIDGKRTGMWEIPLFRLREKKQIKKELNARHPEGIDTRFINRPNL